MRLCLTILATMLVAPVGCDGKGKDPGKQSPRRDGGPDKAVSSPQPGETPPDPRWTNWVWPLFEKGRHLSYAWEHQHGGAEANEITRRGILRCRVAEVLPGRSGTSSCLTCAPPAALEKSGVAGQLRKFCFYATRRGLWLTGPRAAAQVPATPPYLTIPAAAGRWTAYRGAERTEVAMLGWARPQTAGADASFCRRDRHHRQGGRSRETTRCFAAERGLVKWRIPLSDGHLRLAIAGTQPPANRGSLARLYAAGPGGAAWGNLPAGPYRALCRDCRAKGTRLTCDCFGAAGRLWRSTLDRSRCRQPIRSCHGALHCGRCPHARKPPRALPKGSYAQSCPACILVAGALHCVCRSTVPDWKRSALPAGCASTISNIDGELTCNNAPTAPASLPPGPYRQACPECRRYAAQGAMVCACRVGGAVWRRAHLAAGCDKPVSFCAGRLRCGPCANRTGQAHR